MRIKILLPVLLFQLFILAPHVFSQDDDNDSTSAEITMGQEEWHLKRDQYATAAIILLRRLEILDSTIDALKKRGAEINDQLSADCENDLYTLVGTNKEGYEDFKVKFDETEKRIVNKSGTPDDARKMYFDEINESKIRCLPEFSDRFASMKKKLEPWENKQTPEKLDEGTHLVAKGDCLWKISEMKYNTPYLWPVIWDANRISVAKSIEIDGITHNAIDNPNLIYPGQVLKIPKVSNAQKNESRERELEHWRKWQRMKELRKKESEQIKEETKDQ